MLLIFHVTSHNNLFKWPCDYYGWPFTVDHYAANFGGFRNFGSGDKKLLICQVISNDHVFKGFCGFMGGSP